MRKLYEDFNNLFKLTNREYQASLNALNIFFGAVIGVNLGNAVDVDTLDYILLLIVTSMLVSIILVVSYSHRKYTQMVMLVLIFAAVWYLHLDPGEEPVFSIPEKLLVTLSVWALLAISLEFSERSPEPEEK